MKTYYAEFNTGSVPKTKEVKSITGHNYLKDDDAPALNQLKNQPEQRKLRDSVRP